VSYLKGPEDSRIIYVPGFGDCWISALLAPLLGFVPDEDDTEGIVLRARNRLCEIVKKAPNKFKPIFGSQRALEDWCQKITKRRTWSGSDSFQVFVEATGICVHVINEERSDIEAVQHHVPHSETEVDWETSLVLLYGYSHFRAVVPLTLPTSLTLCEKPEVGPMVTIDLDMEEPTMKNKKTLKLHRTKFPKKPSQREKKIGCGQRKEKVNSVRDMFEKYVKKENVKIMEVDDSFDINDPDQPVQKESAEEEGEVRNTFNFLKK
jgi:hypothetical protein